MAPLLTNAKKVQDETVQSVNKLLIVGLLRAKKVAKPALRIRIVKFGM